MGYQINPSCWTYWAISRSIQCSTTGILHSVVCDNKDSCSCIRRLESGRSRNIVYRARSPTPSESTTTTHTSDDRFMSSRRPRTTEPRMRSRGETPPRQARPKSPKRGSRTIINIPHTDVQDEVAVAGVTQTLDEIGTQTDRKVFQQYRPVSLSAVQTGEFTSSTDRWVNGLLQFISSTDRWVYQQYRPVS